MELPATDKLVDRQRDALYNYPADSHKALTESKPWADNPHYFKSVRVSAAALVKMVMHARSGGALEVMGLMQGYAEGTCLVITDAFRLPVDGTETRVNAQDDANEYMIEYLSLCREADRAENIVGWYHSHPGYGCWLSGIDVNTQFMQQQFLDPFVAVVIDPDRTVSGNKVDIGAFRTFPENYKPAGSGSGSGGGGVTSDGYQTVPLNKADDFGAHASRYYALEVEHFKSTLDTKLLELLWNKYWVQTLAQNPLLSNRDYGSSQMLDLGCKVHEVALMVGRTAGRGGGGGGGGLIGGGASSGGGSAGKAADLSIEKVIRDAKQVVAKEKAGLMAAEIKGEIFGSGS
ncbi:JAB1/Mov34/MPN/PAD-1 ubiquitin protease-domain-containing protein [Podospora appendiculata]|uniref:COP9 signalosome complex subunit 5 n=1 Tax=Podospora appendiculata TaxID=314037 RepID=A0AAE0XF23_9PEZI|nr:JAB1/Mov34/MPN/PAD-1 ubiquitin protease-domain-containing protein [Podospora appendiculata]